MIGLIVALSCNLAFLKAILGFFLGAIFFAASIVCQAVFVNTAFFSIEDSTLSGFRKSVIALAERSVGLTASFLGFTLPMVLAAADMGLASESLLILGAVGAAAFLLVYSVVLYFLNASLLKKAYTICPRRKLPFIIETTS